MTESILSAAKKLGELSNWKFTNLQMQKILYFADMFHMGQNEGERMVDGHFEAWSFGPVHPTLYYHNKQCGARPVPENIYGKIPDIKKGSSAEAYIEMANELFVDVKVGRLVQLAHEEGGAWSKHYEYGKRNPLSDESMMQEYENWFSK